MNRYFSFFIRLFFLTATIILTGCSIHQLPINSYDGNHDVLHVHYAPVKNGHIEYYRFGHGSPIVLIPGYVSDLSSWNRDFLSELAKQHQVIVFNNRNVGRSFVRSSHYGTNDLANDTYQLIQDLKLKKPTVIGISMGGMIAQQLAILHSDSVGQLILINTIIAGNKAVHPDATVEEKMRNMPKDKLGRYKLAVELFFPNTWKLKMGYALLVDRFVPDDYQKISFSDLVMSQQRDLVLHWLNDNASSKKLNTMHVPTLILNGKSDQVIPPINSVILAETIPHAQLIRWEEGGHAMIYQFPNQISDVINHFIKE